MRRPATFWNRLGRLWENRSLQFRVLIVFFGMLLLVIAVQSWRAPFPFRLGDYVPHGIAAKIPFQRLDQAETNRARDRAEEQVAYIFRNNPTPLQSLPDELRSALGDIAQADEIGKLAPETKKDFGFESPVEPEAKKRARVAAERFGVKDPDLRFERLRRAVVGPGSSMTQERIDRMVDEFARLIRPLMDYGVVDENVIRLEGIAPNRQILVVDENQPDHTGESKLLSQVRLTDLLNESGELGKSWGEFPALPKEVQPALSYWLFMNARPTLRYDQSATKLAISKTRENIQDSMKQYLEGDRLVPPRKVIDLEDLALLRDEYQAAEKEISWGARFSRVGIVFVMVIVLAAINGYYIVLNEPKLFRSVGRLVTYLTAIVVTAFIARLVSFDPLRAEIIPLLTLVLLIAVAYNQLFATLTAFSLVLILVMSTTGRLDHFLVLLSTCAAAIMPLHRVSSRTTLIKVSFVAAVTYVLISAGAAVVETQSLSELISDRQFLVLMLKGASLCLVGGYLVAGSLPFVEKVFGVVTDMTLLELSDPSHPLLQDLVRLAPGTYNHSIAVASIAENAAEKVGGNGLLVRVGAYFHDIGKMLKPQYFIENLQEGATSRHAQLNPAMSTLIIIGHVKDGADLAEQYNLPNPIIDLIEQHHGTTLVEYFFREATRMCEGQPDHRTDAEESSFRYPGPKPQSKEAGVLMISDACESACRSLTEPTPKRIESLVSNIVMRRLLDGQFDECPLKMSDIRVIQDSVTKSLIAVYHGRIRYPDQEVKSA